MAERPDNRFGVRVRGALALHPEDGYPLARLAPVFLAATAASIVMASAARSLFLAANELSRLPWTFLASALATAAISTLHAATARRTTLERRYAALFPLASASMLVLRALYPLEPATMSVVIAIWLPATAWLSGVMVWNLASHVLPTRQGKRVFPLLGAVATVGAVAGSLLVQGVVALASAEDLLVLAAALLVVPWVATPRALRALATRAQAQHEGAARGPAPAEVERGADSAGEGSQALKDLLKRPLPMYVALVVFTLQVASVLLDYQFSGEMKAAYSKDEIAAFLGRFHLVANAVVIVVSLLAAGRLTRLLGIGGALALGSLFVAFGSGAYVSAALVGLPTLWIVAGAALCNHVGQHGLARNSVQTLLAPLDDLTRERARTLVDGVAYRGATVLGSIVLLFIMPVGAALSWSSPIIIVACLGVLVLGFGVAPHYRAALFSALAARRLDPAMSATLIRGLGRGAIRDVERRLQAADPAVVTEALAVVREMRVAVRPALIEDLAASGAVEVAPAAMATLIAVGPPPSRELVARLLDATRPVDVLRSALRIAIDHPDWQLADRIQPLARHPDTAVGALARTAAGTPRDDDDRPDAVRYADDLVRRSRDGTAADRRAAVDMMGQVRLPVFLGPLMECLSDRALRPAASASLGQFGDGLVAAAAPRLADPALDVAVRMGLLRALESARTPASIGLLLDQAEVGPLSARTEAVLGVWRAARDPGAPHPDDSRIHSRAMHELQRLEAHRALEPRLASLGPWSKVPAQELATAREGAERRLLLLLGMLYDRAALYRALLHYRSPEQRTRSNALELIDQHVTDPALKRFVALLERGPGRAAPPAQPIEALLARIEPSLAHAWRWAERRGQTSEAPGWDEPLDRVYHLMRMPLFGALACEPLLMAAGSMRRRTLKAGDTLFVEGDPSTEVFLVAGGQVAVVRGGRERDRIGPGEVIGEMAVLQDARRGSSIVAVEESNLIELPSAAFRELLDLYPALTRRILQVLTNRLHAALRRREGA